MRGLVLLYSFFFEEDYVISLRFFVSKDLFVGYVKINNLSHRSSDDLLAKVRTHVMRNISSRLPSAPGPSLVPCPALHQSGSSADVCMGPALSFLFRFRREIIRTI